MKIFAIVFAVLISVSSVCAQTPADAAIIAINFLKKQNAKWEADAITRDAKANEINMWFAYWEKAQEDYAKANKKKAGDCKQIGFILLGSEVPINFGNSEYYSYECGLENELAFFKATNKKNVGDCPEKSVFKVTYDAKTSTLTDVSPTPAGCKNDMPFFKGTKTPDNTFRDNRNMQTYRTVKIGNQVWMAENMNIALEKGSECRYTDCHSVRGSAKGRGYRWEAAKEACPEGWELPSKSDFDALILSVGGKNIAGTKLKAKEVWGGFTALSGIWWSASEDTNKKTLAYVLVISDKTSAVDTGNKKDAFSVRCVKK